MNTRMKLLVGAATLALATGALSLGVLPAEAESAAELFLPTSYEQYLPLESPTDVAMNEAYIIVADGGGLYIYQRDADSWSYYEHATYGGTRNITKVGFTPDGRLFFSDQAAQLYLYDFTTKTAQIQLGIPCSTFVIDGETLYTTAVANGTTTFLAFSHRGAGLSYDRGTVIGDLNTPTSIAPHMFVQDGTLYCAINYQVHAYVQNGSSYDHTVKLLAGEQLVQDLTSVAVLGDSIYYTVNNAMLDTNDGLFVTSLREDATPKLLLGGDGFNALLPYGDKLYCVKGPTVREIETNGVTARYTGYEIAAHSDSVNRVSHATDTVRAKNLIVTADVGNGRVSVYNTATKEFSLLDTGIANCVATDGEVIAAGVGSQVSLYHYGDTEPFYVHSAANAVVGVAVVFGRCYYVTEHHYGVAEEGAVEFTRSNSPAALTSDVFGNLYVADAQRRVLKYTEAQFLDRTVDDGELLTNSWRLPDGFRSLRADYSGNVYYLSDDVLYMNGDSLSAVDATGCVYYGKTKPRLVSFALAFEDNGLYLQYGSFIAYTENVAFPTLSAISATDAYGEVFSAPDEAELSFVDVKSGATGVKIDASKLDQESAYFPYDGYYRTLTGGRGVLLSERGSFWLVALFENYNYTVALYPAESCAEAEAVWENATPVTRYSTSDVGMNYYPCLAPSLTIARLPRASEVTLLATVKTEGNFDYAYVQSGSSYGYVPLEYLTDSPPVSALPENYVLGYLKESDEGVLFRAENGDTLLVTERTQVKIYESGNGLYFLRFTRDGVEYTAQVTDRMIQVGDPNALRISLIIVLSVVAVGVLAAFVLFRPRKKE